MIRCFLRSVFGLAFCLVALAGRADESVRQILVEGYESFKAYQERVEKPLPFLLSSIDTAKDSKASVRYFLVDVEMEAVVANLRVVGNWCQFIPLHLNVKACAHFERGGETFVQFYVGRKDYSTPDDAHLLQLVFVSDVKEGVLFVNLFAADGPLDSQNIDFNIRAIGVDEEDVKGVYLEFDLSSQPGLAGNLARAYLATFGRNKIGFSTDGKTWSGKTKYITGQRAAAERNVVRYLFSIETYFSTLDLPEDEIFMARLERWYDATAQYPDQLYELSRKAYIQNKLGERANQEILQQAIMDKVTPVYVPLDRSR